MSEEKAPHQIWLLAREVSLTEAALLVIGVEPQGISDYVEKWEANNRPAGYLAAREAIVSAIRCGDVAGIIDPESYVAENGTRIGIVDTIDYHLSRVEMISLRTWLDKCGYSDTFLRLDSSHETGFRDKEHPRYSAKLAAAVEAWENYHEDLHPSATPKQRLAIWLRLNAARFGLTMDTGLPSETVVEDLAKVANWATVGGAPKQVAEESDPDEIPL